MLYERYTVFANLLLKLHMPVPLSIERFRFVVVLGKHFLFQGDGPKLVRELFRVAEEHAPSIVFIDEIDAVGTKRYDSNSGGEREIQRTMLELLNQLDGFDSRGDVKVSKSLNKKFVCLPIAPKNNIAASGSE